MKPVSRYPPQNTSNPFAQLHPQLGPHQGSHLQHPTQQQSLQHNNFSNAHHAFASAGSQPSIFGPHGTNGSSGVGGNLHGGFGGAGLGGAGSQAAQMGFAHGAAGLQHLQQTHDMRGVHGEQAARIRQVWKHNLNEEMAILRVLIDKYPYISMVRFHFHT
jgi:CCR4-NOT transcription complex subunit 7/8